MATANATSTVTDSSLINILESCDSKTTGLYSLYSAYLNPFADIIKPAKPTKPSDDKTLTRSLAKNFLPFINRTLSILPKRLPELQKSNFDEDQKQALALELFGVYRLCLDCLGSIASQLACKPFSVDSQRIRMVHCLEAWGNYKEAEMEGFNILERLRKMDSVRSRNVMKLKGRFLPDVDKSSGDKEFVFLVGEVAVTLVKCIAMRKSKDGMDYRIVLHLVEEAQRWFMVLDDNTHEKLRRALVTYLGKCALLLVGELSCYERNLSLEFVSATFNEYAKSSLGDQVFKFARHILSSLFAQQLDGSSIIMDILLCVLDSTINKCKIEVQSNRVELVECISYCANKCRAATSSFSCTVATHFNKVAGRLDQVMAPINLILRIYATGLLISNCTVGCRHGDVAYLSLIKVLNENEDVLENLASLILSLDTYFNCEENKQKGRTKYPPYFLGALKFLCQPLAELVNSDKKQFISEEIPSSVLKKLSDIENAFRHFADIFLSCQSQSIASGTSGDGFNENTRAALHVSVAAFTLSIRTKQDHKTSAHFIKNMLGSLWIQNEGLKYIIACLHNISIALFRSKKVNEASGALKLCCRASWIEIGNIYHHDFPERSVMDFVDETCKRGALLLEALHQIGFEKVKNATRKFLKHWSVADDPLDKLPAPTPLVKQWVKIECERDKNVEKGQGSTLYSLLSPSVRLSLRTTSMILEQELIAYEEVSALYPEFSQQMEMKIIGELLQDVYVNEDSYSQRARTFLRKGRLLRICGAEYQEYIQCFSEAINTFKLINNGKNSSSLVSKYQLAVAHCWRALFTQEADPNSKQILDDIRLAIKLWSSMSTPDYCQEDSCAVMLDNILILMYNCLDLVSMKGCVNIHHDIYRLLIRVVNLKNISLEAWLPMMWRSKRTTHGLCFSPVHEIFLTNISDYYGEDSKSIEFWARCLDGSKSLITGFIYNFSHLFAGIPSEVLSQKNPFQSDIKVDDIKNAADYLISAVPVSSDSLFLAGSLYYDLCQRLIFNGKLIEALPYAKEAHRLRSKLFQEKFVFSTEQLAGECNEQGSSSQSLGYCIKKLQMNRVVAKEILCFDSISWDMKGCYLSPWIILRCYLESILQIAIINELIGNGHEAETYLQWGRNIAQAQKSPIFLVSFSSILGKLQCNRSLWDLAEKELQSARQLLLDNSLYFHCSQCKLILEATINQHLGDLSCGKVESSIDDISLERMLDAEDRYRSALSCNFPEWEHSVEFLKNRSGTIHKQTAKDSADTATKCSSLNQPELRTMPERLKSTTRAKQIKKSIKVANTLPKHQSLVPESNSRLTRSRYQSSQKQCTSCSTELAAGVLEGSNAPHLSGTHQGQSKCEQTNFIGASSCDTYVCNNCICCHCLLLKTLKSSLLDNKIHLKWEVVRRKQSVELLLGIGRCFMYRSQIHEAYGVFSLSLMLLVSNPCCCALSLESLPDIVAKEIAGDVFVFERASTIFEICRFCLKNLSVKDTRSIYLGTHPIEFQQLLSWLKLAFVLSREIPLLFQKVARLLAALYTLSYSVKTFSLLSSDTLSASHWASYFHQASIGTHINHQLLSHLTVRDKTNNTVNLKGSLVTGSTYSREETCNLLRLAPETTQGLEDFARNFFAGLPCLTLICISFLGYDYASLLKDLLLHTPTTYTWIMVSRLSARCKPVVILFPIDSISPDTLDDYVNSESGASFESKNSSQQWLCPWRFAMVDVVVPHFRRILQENYLSSSMVPLEDTKETRKMWWKRRKQLDDNLGKLLRNIEESWFGSWKCLFVGECLDSKQLNSVHKKLVHQLLSKCKLHVNEELLKVILRGFSYDFEGCISSKKGCYIAGLGYRDDIKSSILSTKGNESESLLAQALQLFDAAVNELQQQYYLTTEPMILVLDYDVQMLPWENLPVIRNQEVYRMPSVCSISAALGRIHCLQKRVDNNVASFPLIDPLDAFYLLNPSGDLSSTQVQFENWFRGQNFQGKAGSAPTGEEVAAALEKHDLFIYFGHGSGAQYISKHEIQKLQRCAATLLMGCSSGALTLYGCYVPEGTPLSYLLAGSPVIVANLWEVTDKDIDRFGKAMLDALLRERTDFTTCCAECNLSEEFEAMNIRARRKTSKNKLIDTSVNGSHKKCCNHRPKIGSFMGQARDACLLRFLIGAAPVCYGVPTGIRRNECS